MRPEVEVVLLSQPELVIVIVQTFLGQSDHLGGVLQADLAEVVLREMDLPPLLDNFDHLEDYALLAALSFQGGSIRPDLLELLGGDGAGAANGGGVKVSHLQKEDVAVVGVEEGQRNQTILHVDGRIDLMLKVVSPHHFLLHVAHQPPHHLSQIHLIFARLDLDLSYPDTLAALVLNHDSFGIFMLVVLCKHLSC